MALFMCLMIFVRRILGCDITLKKTAKLLVGGITVTKQLPWLIGQSLWITTLGITLILQLLVEPCPLLRKKQANINILPLSLCSI